MLITFLDIRGIVHKEFVLAGQTVSFAYYCDVLRRLRKNVRRLRPEIWRQKNWLFLHDSEPSHASYVTRNFFDKKQHDHHLHPPHFSVLPRFKTELKGRLFDTIEVSEAESQEVLNTLTEHDFQDAFKKCQKHWQQCIRPEGDYFEGDDGL
jgi:hypothetical protein